MVNLTAQFPTASDCRNIDKSRIALHCHFSFMAEQVTIQSTSRGYSVMLFGFVPSWYKGSNISYENWYSIAHFSNEEFHKAQNLFLEVVEELIDIKKPF